MTSLTRLTATLNTVGRVLVGCLLLTAVPAPALASGGNGTALLPIPPVAPVTDQTGTLSDSTKATLLWRVQQLEKEKGAQVAVLVIPTTGPEDIAAYAHRVFDHWKLGRHGVDDGVLFVVAKADRHLRLEIGRGLEGAIPDAYAKRIGADLVGPQLQAGDFDAGVRAGVDAIGKLIDGEALPAPVPRAKAAKSPGSGLPGEVLGGVALLVLGGLYLGLLTFCPPWLAASLVSTIVGLGTGYGLSSWLWGAGAFALTWVVLWAMGQGAWTDGWSADTRDSPTSRDSWSGGGGDSAGGGASSEW